MLDLTMLWMRQLDAQPHEGFKAEDGTDGGQAVEPKGFREVLKTPTVS